MNASSSRRPDEVCPLWPEPVPPPAAGEAAFQPVLECYFRAGTAPAPALVIFPGGGYGNRAQHEGVDIAVRFNLLGFHCFVAQYRVAPYRYPEPQRDALRAIRLVRSRAAAWGVDGRVAVCGFSAGGHLAACTGTLFDRIDAGAGDAADDCAARPDAMVLGYPVITFAEFGHEGSGRNLLGDRFEAKKADLSLEQQVSFNTPPAFLWHTAADEGVPVENSLAFAAAMRRHNLVWELHVFPHGRHGLGLLDEVPATTVWAELAATFLFDNLAPAGGRGATDG